MKKILIFVFVFIMSIQICSAKSNDYTLNFNGTKYHLLYSVKNKDFGGYLNEYYRQGETYNIWSDMVAVHHFPNAYSPIDRIRDFKNYLASLNIPSALTFDDKKNAAMIDFIIINGDKMPIVLEFNIFKYEKSKKCGSVAIQYVKRYAATTTMQVEQIKTDFEKNRKKLIKAVKEFNIPQVITEDIDKCISGAELRKQEIQKDEKTDTVTEPVKNEDTAQNSAETATEDSKIADEINDVNITEEKSEQTEEKNVETLAEENKNTTDDKDKSLTKEETTVIPDKEGVTEKEIVLKEEEKENTTAISAPVPPKTAEPTAEPKANQKKEAKQKKIKEADYQIINTKDDFYAKPRTKKEMKKLKKQNKKELKLKNTAYEVINNKDDLIAKPRTKKEMKEYKKSIKENRRKQKTK